ncbi:hypothetical protein DFP83_105152 [Idiomarina fontislapidosi]|uniref:Sulfotransferase family protein n=1 Tax=Idiomarina fontislapidosi TaxID=263723 RepID=A0A432XYC8_9GAMM|nr:hypothetical protein [Idiomarina fontislapidosi]PYE32844.1 hypothetical protein DFP83_105152 [Idiomarina fontislapidosi]RUO53716.1 hypothetical protein CWE25_07455 [Idiomarina fontislapidosi]
MDNVNKLSWREKMERALAERTRRRILANAARVNWVSYHIPKTAGTSFRSALQTAFGQQAFFAVYEFSGANELSRGEPIWLPASTQVIHGHFRPHSRHKQLFPNGKRITWMRDPIKRAWSLLNHTLDVQNNDNVYQFIKTHFLDRGITDREELFKTMLNNKGTATFFNIYKRDYKTFNKKFFYFVGSTERYNEDLKRLEELMQKPLPTQQLNSSQNKQPAPELSDKERAYFSEEYRIYEKLIS